MRVLVLFWYMCTTIALHIQTIATYMTQMTSHHAKLSVSLLPLFGHGKFIQTSKPEGNTLSFVSLALGVNFFYQGTFV